MAAKFFSLTLDMTVPLFRLTAGASLLGEPVPTVNLPSTWLRPKVRRCSGHDLAFDSAGNLYGTTAGDGTLFEGNVFELIPADGGWPYHDIHDFTISGIGGGGSVSNVLFDASGNMYGTAAGGVYRAGVVWEITP